MTCFSGIEPEILLIEPGKDDVASTFMLDIHGGHDRREGG
jgi:hypothetical protein